MSIINQLTYQNTFGDWFSATEQLIVQINNLYANNYTKPTGTLFLGDTSLGLQVNTNAIIAGNLEVSGVGSGAYIQNNLQVGGNISVGSAFVQNLQVSGNFVISGTTAYSTNTFTVASGTLANENAYFDVYRPSGSNASIKWDEANTKWELLNVNSNTFFNILTGELLSNSYISNSTSNVASSAAVNDLYNYTLNGLLFISGVDSSQNNYINYVDGFAQAAFNKANSTLTINGIPGTLGNSISISANTPNLITFNNSGAGSGTGVTYNGSAPLTVSYNTIGAPSINGANATGTWAINITGNAGTATVANALNTLNSYNVASLIAGSLYIGSSTSTEFTYNSTTNILTLAMLSGTGSYTFDSSGNFGTNANISCAGNLYWGGTNKGEISYDGWATLRNAGNTNGIRFVNQAYNAQTFVCDDTGNVTAAGNITAYSDQRLKTNIVTIKDALSKVNELRGVSFIKDGKNSIGVIAQEVQKVIPEVVMVGNDEEKLLSVAYGNMVGLLIEAIKELKQEIDDLKKLNKNDKD